MDRGRPLSCSSTFPSNSCEVVIPLPRIIYIFVPERTTIYRKFPAVIYQGAEELIIKGNCNDPGLFWNMVDREERRYDTAGTGSSHLGNKHCLTPSNTLPPTRRRTLSLRCLSIPFHPDPRQGEKTPATFYHSALMRWATFFGRDPGITCYKDCLSLQHLLDDVGSPKLNCF